MAEEQRRSSSAEQAAPEDDVELLVQGRAKRSTAGNRLSSLLNVEHNEDDEVTLLFADQEGEDADFDSEAEGGSDVEMDSSSDDEDQGPAGGADDLEGERVLEKQAKADRKKERQKLKIVKRPLRRMARAAGRNVAGQPTSMAPPPKPSKKVERSTWLPSDSLAVRASSRKQTVQNKEVTQKRIKENETRRRRTLQAMEAAASKKEASKTKDMTQEERLTEAARIERVNAKSLNRWEAEEAKRVEERKAKLAALKNRKLDGPYVTLWSGPALWVDSRLRATGVKQVEDVTESERVKARVKAEKLAATQTSRDADEPTDVGTHGNEPETPAPAEQEILNAMSSVVVSEATLVQAADKMDDTPIELPKTADSVEQPSEAPLEPASVQMQDASDTAKAQAPTTDMPTSDASSHLPTKPDDDQPPLIELASRTLVALNNVDSSSYSDHVLAQTSHPKRKNAKATKPTPVSCPITGQPAHFRDPKSGVPYHDTWAFDQIRKLYRADDEQQTALDGARYSELLGCFVGGSRAASGVPEQFMQYSKGQSTSGPVLSVGPG